MRRERSFEGVHTSSAIAMAVMERSGIRALIDERVRFDDKRKLSPGNAVKAMIGPIFDAKRKLPLSGIRHYYRGAPVDLLFGDGVTEESLNDKALARNLDSIFESGMEELFWDCSSMIRRKYGFDSHIKHMDSTNYTVYALPPDDVGDGAAVPAFGGNAKDGRNDLLQYNAATITDGDRIIEYCKAYSGNVSDTVMDSETIDFLKGHVDPEQDTVIADCKLVNTSLITKLNGMGMGFVSKVPAIFSQKVQADLVRSAMTGVMDDLGDGYSVYETESDTVCGELRFIAYRSPKGTRRAMDYLRRQGLKDAQKRFRDVCRMDFNCERDATDCLMMALKAHRKSAYDAKYSIVGHEKTLRRPTPGRPRKDESPPETVVKWKVVVDLEFNEERARELAEEHDISVIVTNLPFSTEDAPNIRQGATTETVLRLYLDQYKVEHTYRLMKSGMGVDSVYVRTPSRANALLFVVAIATLVSSVIDALLKRSGRSRFATVKQASQAVMNSSFEICRETDEAQVTGAEGSVDLVFDYLDGIGLDPSVLFDRYDG